MIAFLVELGAFGAGVVVGLKLFPYLAVVFWDTWD